MTQPRPEFRAKPWAGRSDEKARFAAFSGWEVIDRIGSPGENDCAGASIGPGQGGVDGPTGSGKAAPHAGTSLAGMQKAGADAALSVGARQPAQAASVRLRLLPAAGAVAARRGEPAGAGGTGAPGERPANTDADAGGAKSRSARRGGGARTGAGGGAGPARSGSKSIRRLGVDLGGRSSPSLRSDPQRGRGAGGPGGRGGAAARPDGRPTPGRHCDGRGG